MVIARNGMVCTSQPLAAGTGLLLMRNGGNAFDAAVGAAAVLNVVEPMSTGLGGDMFALAWPAGEGRLVGLNGSGRSASTANTAHLRKKGLQAVPTYGADAVTVPGAFDGWVTLLAKYGKLPLEVVLADAIRYAEEGFPVSEVVASNWEGALRHREVPEFAATYLLRDGDSCRTPRTGENFRQPALACTLRALARGGVEEFYRGELARKIANYLQSKGSLIRLEDLARHESTWVEPISTEFGGYEVHELPPNGQGIVALEMLNILEGYDLESLGHNSADYLHLIAEAKKLAFLDRDRYVTDPGFRELPVPTLLSKEYAARMRNRIDPERRGSFPRSTLDTGSDTVYLCTADGEGNAVSFINSLFHGFGSGLVVPETGLCLQNRGALFSLEEGHLNSLEPSKRPLNTIIPAMVTQGGRPWFCFGVMGGDMQPQGQVQVFLNMAVFGMNPQEAGEAARMCEVDGALAVESGVSREAVEGLRAKGHRIVQSPGGFGGYQGILMDRPGGVLYGASENRKDGCAVGY